MDRPGHPRRPAAVTPWAGHRAGPPHRYGRGSRRYEGCKGYEAYGRVRPGCGGAGERGSGGQAGRGVPAQTAGLRSAQGAALSSCAASRNSRSSRP